MATETKGMGPATSIDLSDLLAQFRWYLVMLAGSTLFLVGGVVFDSVLGYPAFGGLLAAFGVVSGSLILAVGLVLLAYRTL